VDGGASAVDAGEEEGGDGWGEGEHQGLHVCFEGPGGSVLVGVWMSGEMYGYV
jgi:hypothetical protein